MIISAVFTKCWTKPRPKFRLLDQDKLSAPFKSQWAVRKKRRSCGQTKGSSAEEDWKYREDIVETGHLQPVDPNAMELYLDLHSQPCRSVFLFAKVAGIPFEFKHVELSKGNPTLPNIRRHGTHTMRMHTSYFACFRLNLGFFAIIS